jgi:hypothetical protein
MGSIPTEQWAQVIEQTGGPVDYKRIPVQKPGPDEVLVNIKYSGVCHTDLHAVNGDWPLVSFTLLSRVYTASYMAVIPHCHAILRHAAFKTYSPYLATHKLETNKLSRPPSCPSLEATKVPVSSSPSASSSRTSKLVTMPVSNGSTDPASPAISANKPTSRYAPSPSSPATQSMVPSRNTASPKPPTLRASPRSALSTPLPPFSALVSPSTRA